jgi:hypothetical protein
MSEINDPYYIILVEVSQRLVKYISEYIEVTYLAHSYVYSNIRMNGIPIFSVSLGGGLTITEISMRLSACGYNSRGDIELYNGAVSDFREEILMNSCDSLKYILDIIPNHIIDETKKYEDRIVFYENKMLAIDSLVKEFSKIKRSDG